MSLLLAVLFAAAPAVDARPPSLALPGINGVRLEKGEAELYGELLGQALHAHGFAVLSSRDVGAMLGLDRQKQLMGCSEGQCLTEMMGALGVDGLLLGDVGLLSDEYTVSVKVLSTQNGQTVALHSGRVKAAKFVPDELKEAARDLAHQLAGVLHRPDLEPTSMVATSSGARQARLLPLVPLIAGVAVAAAGAVFEVLANQQFDVVQTTKQAQAAVNAAATGRTFETAGWAMIGVGATAAVAGLVWLLLGGSTGDAPSAALSVAPGGLIVGLTGVVP